MLDDYTGANAGYSVARKLRDAYSGSAIRVRRSSDNAEQDIGFLNNKLDQSSLTTFIGANDGFITTIYDQATNKDLTMTTATQQPRIVLSGVVETLNGNPCARFDGVNDTLKSSVRLTDSTNLSMFMVSSNYDLSNTTSVIFSQYINASSPSRFIIYAARSSDNRLSAFQIGSFYQLTGTPDTNQHYRDYIKDGGGNAQINYDNTDNATGTVYAGNTDGTITYLGSVNYLGVYSSINFQEGIFYNNNQTANRVGIRDNINNYYGIF